MRYLLSESSAAIVRGLASRRGGVAFEARRIASPPGGGQGMQWRIATTRSEAQGESAEPTVSVAVSVGPGVVAWGAGISYANPGADPLGTLAPGESARVVWRTTAPPIPLVHDPRWPSGGAPDCADPDCNCPEREGDPGGTGGDSGELLLVPLDWIAPDGTTDCREIGLVEVSDAGAATISQIQRDTIVALAIVGRTDPGGDDPEQAPPCGNPLNAESDYNPLDFPPGQGGGEGGSDNPLDNPGEGGYTPSCADDFSAA